MPARKTASVRTPVKAAPPVVVDKAPYRIEAMAKAPRGALRIATWNINSVRLRIERVKQLIDFARPDVICLQETKSPDEHFPRAALASFGYPHQAIAGMKGYNGVAIFSHLPLHDIHTSDWCGKSDCRHISASVDTNGTRIELHNLYVPAGGDIPDPKTNPKFDHKLNFLREQREFWSKQPKNGALQVLVGDLNVAPFESDVWSHKQLLDVVSHTPVETDLLKEMVAAHDWVDAARALTPEPTRLYSWWSYRNQDWKASDRGRRLDHIWLTPALKPALRELHIVKGARDWTQPSDHVPVVADLKL